LQENKAYFLLFRTIHDVLKAEKLLKHHGLTFELVPVPRNLSSDCGMCVKLTEEIDGSLSYLATMNIDRCFYFDGRDYIGREDLVFSAAS
jgi:hypothetical protein